MKYQRFPNVSIESIYCGLPKGISNIDSLAVPLLERTRFTRLAQKLGVSQTHVETYPGELLDICEQLIYQSLGDAKLSINEISTLICVTQTNQYLIPGLSSLIQSRIPFPIDSRFIDLNQGCSGFIDSVQLVSNYLSNENRHALVITMESMSSILDPVDFGNRLLFGDSTSVTLLQFSEESTDMSGFMRYDGNHFKAAFLESINVTRKSGAYFSLNGPQILSLALTAFEDLLLFLSELQITLEEIDFVVPHQANRFILDNLIRRYSLDSRKFIVEMNDVGNTSCNSIPLAICIAQEIHNFSNKDCILLGFGNGLSWGALRVKFGQIRLKIAY